MVRIAQLNTFLSTASVLLFAAASRIGGQVNLQPWESPAAATLHLWASMVALTAQEGGLEGVLMLNREGVAADASAFKDLATRAALMFRQGA
jgi:hypothetical protein